MKNIYTVMLKNVKVTDPNYTFAPYLSVVADSFEYITIVDVDYIIFRLNDSAVSMVPVFLVESIRSRGELVYGVAG